MASTDGGPHLKRCDNCQQDVPAARYEMHSAFCSRNIYRCASCGERMPISERDDHEQAVHGEAQCKCGEKMERRYLERHLAEACLHRQVSCDFCDLVLPLYNLLEHAEICGARTENCVKCLQLVRLRDMDDHIASGCTRGSAS